MLFDVLQQEGHPTILGKGREASPLLRQVVDLPPFDPSGTELPVAVLNVSQCYPRIFTGTSDRFPGGLPFHRTDMKNPDLPGDL